MNGPDVHGQVPFLSEAAPAPGHGALEDLPLFETDVTVRNLEVTTQFARCRADNRAIGTFWWVNCTDVFLEQSVTGECHRAIIRALVGALGTAESLVGVESALVRTQMPCRVERHGALLPCARVHVRTGKWFLLQVHCRDVFLERGMLPERLVAGCILGAPIFISSVVRSQMASQS